MRKWVLPVVMLALMLAGMLPTVGARGGEGGGAASIWLWNYEQQRLIRLYYAADSEPQEIPLHLPEGYQLSGATFTADGHIMAICMVSSEGEEAVVDTMLGIYDADNGDVLIEPQSFGGTIACTHQFSMFDMSSTYFAFSVFTAAPSDDSPAQWDLHVMNVNSGEIAYSLSNKQAEPDNEFSTLPMVVDLTQDTVRLFPAPFADETLAPGIHLLDWHLASGEVELLDTYPLGGLNMLANGDMIMLAQDDESMPYSTVIYQSLGGESYPIYTNEEMDFWHSMFIDDGRKILVVGSDTSGAAHIFMLDRMGGVVELEHGADRVLVPSPMGYVTAGVNADGVYEVQSVLFDKQGNMQGPSRIWSDTGSTTWIVLDYRGIQLPDELLPFEPVTE